jgi:outer membrane receptor for ferrienterochelin and colicins
MLIKTLMIVILSIPTFSAMAHENEENTIEVHEKLNRDLPLSRLKKDSTRPTEVVKNERVEHKNANSLAKAVDLEPGVQTTLTCATCGSQRITLNGLRGENTTILIDGIPALCLKLKLCEVLEQL